MPAFDSMKELTDYLDGQEKRVLQLEIENQKLNSFLTAHYVRKEELAQIRDSARQNTNLVSPSFLIRAFTVWGHHFVAQLIISVVLGLIIAILGASFFSNLLKLMPFAVR